MRSFCSGSRPACLNGPGSVPGTAETNKEEMGLSRRRRRKYVHCMCAIIYLVIKSQNRCLAISTCELRSGRLQNGKT